ncbi:unannotated protein [freshwater metagenome]|uniref:Unannotated protein n=1 Tax=freshwater metagenome TaxID=449393 RepID=A0A6J7ELW9_9ZZZZ|nr:hypothetical protein [Actinomycetota bacterium]
MTTVRTRRHDRGQALPLVMITVVLVMTLGWGVGTLALQAAQRSAAQNAADAAALAAQFGGADVAGRAAALNGARIISYSETTDGGVRTIRVTTQVGEQRAVAQASNAP